MAIVLLLSFWRSWPCHMYRSKNTLMCRHTDAWLCLSRKQARTGGTLHYIYFFFFLKLFNLTCFTLFNNILLLNVIAITLWQALFIERKWKSGYANEAFILHHLDICQGWSCWLTPSTATHDVNLQQVGPEVVELI